MAADSMWFRHPTLCWALGDVRQLLGDDVELAVVDLTAEPAAPPPAAAAAAAAELAAALRDAAIDAEQRRAAAQAQECVRLLLLGSGESGKSTVFKQLRLLYGGEDGEQKLRALPGMGALASSSAARVLRKRRHAS